MASMQDKMRFRWSPVPSPLDTTSPTATVGRGIAKGDCKSEKGGGVSPGGDDGA